VYWCSLELTQILFRSIETIQHYKENFLRYLLLQETPPRAAHTLVGRIESLLSFGINDRKEKGKSHDANTIHADILNNDVRVSAILQLFIFTIMSIPCADT
jgi:hypothetical protein